ncbi:MAG: DUF4169 family protein [Pseudomonadota bacterium]
MTADIINLRQARKAKARADKEAKADANRRKHGRTKAERLAEEDARRRAERRLDGLMLDCRRDGADDAGSGKDDA